MRIIFMGTPDFAVPTLRALHAAGHEVVAAYTQPPRRSGRGKKEQPSAVHNAAAELDIPVRHPVSLRKEEAQLELAAFQPDIAVVAAYGLILPQTVLDIPTHGCLNVHGSILPRWRGAAPVQRAIEAGDKTTGITIMQMEAGLDTGPMLAKVETPIASKTAGELTEELAELGANLMVEVLEQLDQIEAVPQPEDGVTYASKIDKAEARIDWNDDAVAVERKVRAFAPFPGAWFELGDNRVKLLLVEAVEGQGAAGKILDEIMTIACGTGAIRPVRLQRAGKPAMDRDEFLRGNAVSKGTILT